jgi:hypothetical protein
LFEEGIAGLKYALPRWDYREQVELVRSRVSEPTCLSHLNCLLLQVLASLSKQPSLADYAQRWSPKQLSRLERTEIYLVFVLTKNANRLRYRTWRQKVDEASSGFADARVGIRSTGKV